VAPDLLDHLSRARRIALVSGTNGKTTTTACLAAALGTVGEVATNHTGSNMQPGHVAALGASRHAPIAVLECDEVWMASTMQREQPEAVVLLNLSRDQLDRTSEVRRISDAWREALAGFDGICVANADDPLVVHAALASARPAWFAGGLVWGDDAVACPRCARRLTFAGGSWDCDCGFARPASDASVDTDGAVVDGRRVAFAMSLPGEFNRANGLGALLAATRMGADPDRAAAAIASLDEVAGRFSRIAVDGRDARLLLAKNPAGWSALLDLVGDEETPVVVAVNARVADGHDPSWLYDVAFERLRGRRVVASGERWRDLSTRLYYGGVEHEAAEDPRRAIAMAGGSGESVEVIANYTAFADLKAGA
jgi:UDP-N-acetylmuramyl tripeptide synthase